MGDLIFGWHHSPKDHRTALRIGGTKLFHARRSIPRPDAQELLRLDSDELGFELVLPSELFDGKTHRVELLSVGPDKVEVVSAQDLHFPVLDAQGATVAPPEPDAPGVAPARTAAVVCWDLGHNPAGRALVLYDILSKNYDRVDLIGPLIPRFGKDLWAPLRGLKGLRVIAEPVKSTPELYRFARRVSQRNYDLVWICKPRWPALMIGLFLKEASDCRVVLDIDDYEMSFFKDRDTAKRAAQPLAALRAGKIHMADLDATILAHAVIDQFRLRTVSNVSLQRMFGGEIVPHTRSADVFDRKAFNRDDLRAEFGLPAKAEIVVFIGTIRRHKGVLDIARAVAASKRKNVHLLTAGAYENEGIKAELSKIAGDRLTMLGDVPFADLPKFLAAGDLICLPQDPEDETSHFQLPAKIADGLAMGLKIVVNDLPPYDDMADVPGLFIRPADQPLEEALDAALAARVSPAKIRKGFETRFSSETLSLRSAAYFATVPPASCLDDDLTTYKTILGRAPRSREARFAPAITGTRPRRDLVVLWKQIDSGLFGRRVDMTSKYLLESGAFDRVVMLDAPISAWKFQEMERNAAEPGLSNQRLLYDAFVTRFLGQADSETMIRRSFAFSERGETVLGRSLMGFEDLNRDFAALFDEIQLAGDATLWICPVVPHLPQVLRARDFPRVIADLIDDQREFVKTPEQRARVHDNYIYSLSAADTVFTNNDAMAQRFMGLSSHKIHVVPNGVERARFDASEVLHLEGLAPGTKVVGYLGNLRDRIDAQLIRQVADAGNGTSGGTPYHVVLVGPTGGNPDIERLGQHRNVTLTGPMTYERGRRVAAGFDVAMIPHKIDKLTESMNPLKFFLYRELGLPIVTTPVDNLGKRDDRVIISAPGDAKSFVDGVQVALNMSPGKPGASRSKAELWETRVAQIAKHSDFGRAGSAVAKPEAQIKTRAKTRAKTPKTAKT